MVSYLPKSAPATCLLRGNTAGLTRRMRDGQVIRYGVLQQHRVQRPVGARDADV